jgi:hypothetical protein
MMRRSEARMISSDASTEASGKSSKMRVLSLRMEASFSFLASCSLAAFTLFWAS